MLSKRFHNKNNNNNIKKSLNLKDEMKEIRKHFKASSANPAYHSSRQVIVMDNYYIHNGQKYHLQFPIGWALDHRGFVKTNDDSTVYEAFCSGPKGCYNCRGFMQMNDIFIGYCSNCLYWYEQIGLNRGKYCAIRFPVWEMSEKVIEHVYPYMNGFQRQSLSEGYGNFQTKVDLIDGEIIEEEENAIENEEEREDDEYDCVIEAMNFALEQREM
jgi:hypothetical protein